MVGTVDVTSDQVLRDLRAFLINSLPNIGADNVIQGQINRVPEPEDIDFIVMTPVFRTRLALNIDTFVDVQFVGSIAGKVLTVTSIAFGTIEIGAVLLGAAVRPFTGIQAQTAGVPGSTGTYLLSISQSIPVEQKMAAGLESLLQKTRVDIQLDFHGDNAEDYAQIVSTLLRDDRGVTFFAGLGHGISPLYTTDPHQTPFINEQQQYEYRWTMEAHLQINPVVQLSQEFADTLNIGIVDVDATYPA